VKKARANRDEILKERVPYSIRQGWGGVQPIESHKISALKQKRNKKKEKNKGGERGGRRSQKRRLAGKSYENNVCNTYQGLAIPAR